MSEHAAPSVKAYVGVLVALIVGTVLTVGAAQMNLGHAGNIALGLGIAVVKASLVVLVFMQMKYEKRWWTGLILFPLALVMIILFANFPDTALNGGKDDENGFTTPAQVYDAKEKKWVDPSTVPAGGATHH